LTNKLVYNNCTNFVVSGPKFAKSFLSNVGGIVVHNAIFHLLHLDLFRRYSWPKSKVVRNRAKFWTFFAFTNFVGAAPGKSVPKLSYTPYGISHGKVSRG